MAKILIIDDDPDMVKAMRVVLESKNYQVETASSGKEGLKKAEQGKPDLIILDVMMENLDTGFEVSRELKKDCILKDIPILMLTSIKERTGLDFEKEAGDKDWLPVDAYCDKPLNPDDLVAKVEALLQKRQ
ncbi:MAG: response regulator [Candidatus Omnitrophica bacterium]|nr:response regulator [Candidatus Omnitrophota bacterium]